MGCGGSKAKQAPAPTGEHLKAYFQELNQFVEKEVKAALEDPMAMMMQVMEDPEGFEAAQQKKVQELNGKLIPHIKNAFGAHDRDNSECLDPQESKLFFDNYTSNLSSFLKAIAEMAMMQGFQAAMRMLQEMAGDDPEVKQMMEEAMKEAKAEIDEALKEMKENVDNQMKDYRANKTERDAEAFKAIDVNGDGQLVCDEVIKALTPDTEENQKMMRALGFQCDEMSGVVGGLGQ